MPLPGCYLGHVAGGQARLLHAARPLDQVLADPGTTPEVRDALAHVGPALGFARRLGLEVGRQYRSYAAWSGDRVVTSVVATRPGALEPAGFWFPIVGRVPYKGFFDPARAEREAGRLRAEGLDVCVVPVPAYSTLGWFADPVTGPMLRGGIGPLVETLLHELMHATVFAADDADLNEGVATFVGQEGAVRFFAATQGPEAAARERARVEDERTLARALGALRARVDALYADGPEGQALRAMPDDPEGQALRAMPDDPEGQALRAMPDDPEGQALRAMLSNQARDEIAALPLRTMDAVAVAAAARLNDACLALAGTYEADLDAHAARLAALGGDLGAFVAAVRAAAHDEDPRRALGLPQRSREREVE
jgi:predicted aminopeptidase